MEIRRIFRTGNSLVMAIPKAMLKWSGLREGDRVMLQNAVGGNFTVKPIKDELVRLEEEGVINGQDQN
jgi:antitoxin component of MazEF toxin-antitoxin module